MTGNRLASFVFEGTCGKAGPDLASIMVGARADDSRKGFENCVNNVNTQMLHGRCGGFRASEHSVQLVFV